MTDFLKVQDYLKNEDESIQEPCAETQFYMNVFKFNENNPRFASWNWSAFLFGPLWLIYRKMYLYTFLSFILFILCELSQPKTGAIFQTLILGIFGNAIYMRDIQRRIENNTPRRGTSAILATAFIVAIGSVAGLMYYYKFDMETIKLLLS